MLLFSRKEPLWQKDLKWQSNPQISQIYAERTAGHVGGRGFGGSAIK
jgi:hypothetical protein